MMFVMDVNECVLGPLIKSVRVNELITVRRVTWLDVQLERQVLLSLAR